MIDSLTGCHSRYAYERRLEEEFQRWQRHSQPLTFSVWDIDLFKRVNDSYGHEAGDRLLRAVTQLFAQNKRAEDFLARIGGEEFALLLPMTQAFAAQSMLAERIRRAVSQHGIETEAGPVSVTVSIGVASLGPQVSSLEQLLMQADARMYEAKDAGRNQVA